MIKNKKGSHVGMIISFVVFVTFLLFLFFILEPFLGVNEEKESSLGAIEASLLDYLTSDLTTISVNINDDFDVNINKCLQFIDITPLNETELDGNRMFVKNATGTDINFDWRSDPDWHLRVENDKVNRFFKIYASNGISSQEGNLNGCENVQKNKYTLGVVKAERHIFEQSILNALELYQTNYSLLRQNIGLMAGEFGFDFIYSNGTILSTGESTQRVSVYTKETSIDYLDTSLNSNEGSIIIRTW
jgi:uncharacterized protein YegP (UPF0339 family)